MCQHRILMIPNDRPIRMQRYRMNPNYAKKVKEEIDNLLKAGFIAEVESSGLVIPHCGCSQKEWKAEGLRGLQKVECPNHQRPISIDIHWLNVGPGCWPWDVQFYGWLQWIQLAGNNARRQGEDHVHYRMGGIHVSGHAFWAMQHPGHLLAMYDGDFCWFFSWLFGHLCRWFQGIQHRGPTYKTIGASVPKVPREKDLLESLQEYFWCLERAVIGPCDQPQWKW